MKTPVVNKPEYTMYLELFDSILWFHTDVHAWSADIKKKYILDLDVLQRLATVPLLALVEEEDTKLAKFGETIGWYKINKLITNDKKYDVYTRRV